MAGNTADNYIGLNSSLQPALIDANATILQVGDDAFPYSKGDCAAILVFQLPDLGGERIAAANLSVYWEADYAAGAGSGHPGSTDTTVPKWCDLYALRTSSSSTVLTSDYGYKTVIGSGNTPIQEQFLYAAASTTMNPVQAETGALSAAILATWLNDQIDAGAQPGNFVFLRIHGQFDTGNPFTISSANNAITNQRPTLILITGELPPIAAFDATPVTGIAPMTVTFNDLSLGSITNRFWNFGDGSGTNTEETLVSHTYSTGGTYTVSLTVSGAAGADSSTRTNFIIVRDPVAPSAIFTVDSLAGRAPLTVTFTDSSTGDITNRIWRFGDGSITNTSMTTLQYTYEAAGSFTVELTCAGPAGTDTLTKTNLITTATPLPPGVYEISGDSADRTIGVDTNGALVLDWAGQPAIQCADDHYSYGRGKSSAILVFQLPDIGTQTVASANLTVEFEADYIQAASVTNDNILPKSAALYALRANPESAVLTNDYGFRTFIPSGNTLIQEEFLVQPVSENASPSAATTDPAGSAALGGWLQAQYDAGAQPGDCIFLRIHANHDSYSPFLIASADSASPPVLLISTEDTNEGTPLPPTVSLGGTNSTFGSGLDVIRWTTVQGSGYVYSIWISTNLLEGFQPLEVNLPDTVQTWTNFITSPSVFYKIEVH